MGGRCVTDAEVRPPILAMDLKNPAEWDAGGFVRGAGGGMGGAKSPPKTDPEVGGFYMVSIITSNNPIHMRPTFCTSIGSSSSSLSASNSYLHLVRGGGRPLKDAAVTGAVCGGEEGPGSSSPILASAVCSCASGPDTSRCDWALDH